jgi:hypothetical protein
MNTINEMDYKITGMNLWIFGYQEAAETLFELPGWPKSMRPELFNAGDIYRERLPLLVATITSTVPYEFKVTDICDALNALRRYNYGYFTTFYQIIPQASQPHRIVRAWLTSPGVSPVVLGARNKKWPQLVKRLIGGQWQEGRHLPEELRDLSGLQKIERTFIQYRVLCKKTKELDNALGG